MAQSSSQKSNSKFDPYAHLNVGLNADGSLSRFVELPTTPVTGENPQIEVSVLSKEIVLNPQKETSIRVYRPSKIPSNDNNSVAKLPIVFYYHPGGWIVFRSQNTIIHEICNQVADQVRAIVISVDYRLAPESKLPAQYDDAIDALKWLHNQVVDENGDQWVKDYGDSSRVYLYGSSCGGNIAYNVALKVLDMNFDPITIVGMILNQPLFGGKKRTKSELSMANDPFFPLPVIDLLWDFALPKGIDRDHRYCNPFNCAPFRDKLKRLARTLVIGFGGDPLIDRQEALVEMLVLQGVQVEARFDDVGFHSIDMIDSRRAAVILSFVKDFII